MANITFGIIVLNGEPFTEYCIRSLYPHAHEIIVVEGAAAAAARYADASGHSSDGTLSKLQGIASDDDPDCKLRIVTAEDEGHPDGFWPGEKLEQSRAYAKRATGDVLWQVDIDEFYKAEDVEKVAEIFDNDKSVEQVAFRQIAFWGGFDYVLEGWYYEVGTEYMRSPGEKFIRAFRWSPDNEYVSHRPPTVAKPDGTLTSGREYDYRQLARTGVYMYHYVAVFPQQVENKVSYYANAEWKKRRSPPPADYAQNRYWTLQNPFRLHFVQDYPSWLRRFRGSHPREIERLRTDIKSGVCIAAIRGTHDIEALLHSPMYLLRRAILSFYTKLVRLLLPHSTRLIYALKSRRV